MKTLKNTFTILLFSLLIIGFCVAFLLLPPREVSVSERRKLASFPEVSVQNILSQEFSGKLETYLLDHFPLRESFRKLHAHWRVDALQQTDINGLWELDDSVFKYEGDFEEEQVAYGISLVNRILTEHCADMQVYTSIIPDKNYYLPMDSLRPRFDYDSLIQQWNEGVQGDVYVDLFPVLTLQDYYRTDTHWSQERILPVVQTFAKATGFSGKIASTEEYQVHALPNFYGVYYGQAALPVEPDTLYYLTSKNMEQVQVYGIDPQILKEKFGLESTLSDQVYALDRFYGMDGYDIFLSGAQPLIWIESPDAKTDKELILFRDSFGSSIAPLLTELYAKITLIDLRYFPSMLLEEYVEFKPGQDVWFLHSAALLNRSRLWR